MNNWVKLWDDKNFGDISFTSPDGELVTKDAYLSADHQILRVKFAATHAGIITRNNGFYLPGKMRDSTSTWTDQFHKPIQLHHKDEEDPIGRVVTATYIDTSHSLSGHIQNALVKADISLHDFIEDKYSFINQLHVVDELNSLGVLEDPDYSGLGYIELVADIADPDAIKKILDRRYLTGSVGATTNKAICSISDCRRDWADSEGRCEHRPGRTYKKQRCFIVAGSLKYGEYSICNGPADPHSSVLEYSFNGFQDSIEVQPSARIYEVGLTVITDTESNSNKKEVASTTMKKETKKETVVVQDSQDQSTVADAKAVEDKVELNLESAMPDELAEKSSERNRRTTFVCKKFKFG